MDQFVKQVNNADEEKVNLVISEQSKRGYKAISMTSGLTGWGTLAIFILFEKVETNY